VVVEIVQTSSNGTIENKGAIRALDKLPLRIVMSGLVSAGLPCFLVEVEIKCRLTRQRVVH